MLEPELTARERSRLVEAISRLPDLQAEVIVRYYLRDESQEIICVKLGLTELQFHQTHHAALKNLQRTNA